MEEKNSFVFYKTTYEAIKELDTESQATIYNAIMEYSFSGIEIELPAHLKAIFILIKAGIDSANKRYQASAENGKKGGRPKKQNLNKPNDNLEEPNSNLEEPNHNLNVNVNDNVNDNNICPSEDEHDISEDFEKIWELYPRKEGKNTAFKHYATWLKGKKYAGKKVILTNKQMWLATKKYADLMEETKTERQYIKAGSTFFNEAILEYVEMEE